MYLHSWAQVMFPDNSDILSSLLRSWSGIVRPSSRVVWSIENTKTCQNLFAVLALHQVNEGDDKYHCNGPCMIQKFVTPGKVWKCSLSQFLTPKRALGVTMSVCLSVRAAHTYLEQIIFIYLGQRAIREQSENSQRTVREHSKHSESTQSTQWATRE